MRWSRKIATVGGTEVRVHLTFFVLLAWVAVEVGIRDGLAAASAGVGMVVLLFGSVVLHELGHAAAAARFGIPTTDITLLPIGGVARLSRIPARPRQELAIALAGPAVTLVLSAVLYAVVRASAGGGTGFALRTSSLAAQLLVANVVLLGFNLLPAFPTDGGRVLRALLALRWEHLRATRAAALLGQAFGVLFVFAGALGDPLLLLLGLFIVMAARSELAAAEHDEARRRAPASRAAGGEAGLVLRSASPPRPGSDAPGAGGPTDGRFATAGSIAAGLPAASPSNEGREG